MASKVSGAQAQDSSSSFSAFFKNRIILAKAVYFRESNADLP